MALTVALLAVATPGAAADFSDPTWPCIQRKVESLSAGLMWSVPADPAAVPDDPELRAEIRELAGALALRRVALEDLRPQVEAFAKRHDGDPDILGAVFLAVFDSLNTRRTRIINGIGDFSLGQIDLAEKIKVARDEMDVEMARAEPDFDRVDALEEQLDWDQVIYTDRQTSIQYLCETPVIIEKRLFAIAQMMQPLVRQDG
jgi:hypothetical protein